MEELYTVDSHLKQMTVDKIVWEFENLKMPRPNGITFPDDAKNLSEFFVTKKGKPLIPVIESRIQLMIKQNKDVTFDTSYFKFAAQK